MNLVAKEYVASQVDNDGVLVLSERTGAHRRLGDHAVSVDPHDVDGLADGIERAIHMNGRERFDRMRRLRRLVHEADLSAWLEDVLAAVEADRRPAPPAR
jgi:trehalose 6-phosphate synthase